MQVVEKMANFDGIRSTYHTFSYLIYLHMALDQCQWFGYDWTWSRFRLNIWSVLTITLSLFSSFIKPLFNELEVLLLWSCKFSNCSEVVSSRKYGSHKTKNVFKVTLLQVASGLIKHQICLYLFKKMRAIWNSMAMFYKAASHYNTIRL
jgi:hypothetical protein